MKLRTFASNVTALYLTGKCYNLRSKPGRGKTSVISQAPSRIAADLNKTMGFVYISCPTLTPADTVGYLIPGKDENGHSISNFTRPFWWYTAEGKALEEYQGGIIFLDEEDKADPDIKKIIGEMGLTGRVGPHTIPEGWVVWSAGNYRADRSGSTRDLDHLINRRCELELEDDIDGWLEWGVGAGVNGVAMSFGRANPGVVFSENPPETQGPWCTPRSFIECIDALSCFIDGDGKLPHHGFARALAEGFIGKPAAAQLMAHIRLEHDLPALADIMNDPMGCKVPSRPDASYLVAYSLAARTTKDNLAVLFKYVNRLPTEFGTLYADAVCKRDVAMVDTPEMEDWLSENASMLVAVTRYRGARKTA